MDIASEARKKGNTRKLTLGREWARSEEKEKEKVMRFSLCLVHQKPLVTKRSVQKKERTPNPKLQGGTPPGNEIGG